MTAPRTPPDPAGPAIPPEPPCRALHRSAPPVADVQGDRRPAQPPPETAALAGPDVPEGGAATSGTGRGRSRSPGAAQAQGDAEGRKAWQAALSAQAKAQRQQRGRPWARRDPYRKAVPGARKLPPGGEPR